MANQVHVFLSFRGETRNISYSLYKALNAEGILAFVDKNDIGVGDELNSTIQEGIKSSMSSIIVFSQNYAYSTWCLDELVLILQRSKSSRYFILPIFYEVDPRDIKYQLGNYGLALEKHMTRHSYKVQKWREALSQVGNIFGQQVGSEDSFIPNVVELFRKKMAVKFPQCPLPPPKKSFTQHLPSKKEAIIYMASLNKGLDALGLAEKVLKSRYVTREQDKSSKLKLIHMNEDDDNFDKNDPLKSTEDEDDKDPEDSLYIYDAESGYDNDDSQEEHIYDAESGYDNDDSQEEHTYATKSGDEDDDGYSADDAESGGENDNIDNEKRYIYDTKSGDEDDNCDDAESGNEDNTSNNEEQIWATESDQE